MSVFTRPYCIEIEVDAEVEYYPGCDARMYLANGDPGYPAEPDEAEVQRVFIGTGDDRRDITSSLTPDQITELEEKFLEDGIDFEPPGDY